MDLALDTFSGWVNDCFAFDSHVDSCFAFDKHEGESLQGSFDLPKRGDYDKFLPIIYHPDRATRYKRCFFFFFNHHQPKEKNYHLNILNELEHVLKKSLQRTTFHNYFRQPSSQLNDKPTIMIY
jgi:hypothetical protein